MSLPPIDLDPVMLAARTAMAMSLTHRVAYSQLTSDLLVAQFSSNFPALMDSTGEEIVGQPITDLLWEFVGAESLLQEILRGDSLIYRLEHVNREQENGEIIYLNFQVTPFDERQPERGLLLLVEDGTEYGRLQQTLVQDRNELRLLQQQLTQKNQELQRLNRLKSIFLSMSAHDLRGPLTAISGYASFILDIVPEGELPDVHYYLQIMLIQADRLNRLINDFLDLDQIEEGKLILQPDLYYLNDVIEEAIIAMQLNADSRQITMTVNLPEPPAMLWIDRDKIYRVIYNLVGNAIKYTQVAGHVQVQLCQIEDQAVLKVIDNGRGMTKEQVGQLFQLYYRTDEARRSKMRGTGLGLYVVKMLVEAHGGRIEVASQPDRGSTFTVYLPLQKPIE